MSYQVLARKWRPRRFDELVGQAHVIQALTNGLDQDRVHHAFLFTGTRGVGKTTLARILAKCLNCETGVTSRPCGECASCVDIDEGRFVDMLEIDAASRTKVEDTRELLESVQYTPTRGRYKVYIIDEAHMLSTSSFNALLKTLEEPPPHVKFVLATTDPERIPVTILSRCLQFNLRRLLPDQVQPQLARIVEAEGIEAEEEALARLARAADGSMRDGLSLLDQAVAFGGGSVTADDVEQMLGLVDHRHVAAVLEALADGHAPVLLDIVGELVAQSRDLDAVLVNLAETLHRICLVQCVPEYRDDERSDWASIRELAERLSPEDAQLFYQIAIKGRSELGIAPDPRTGLEMTLLRMFAFRPAQGADGGSGGAGGGRSTKAGHAPAETSRSPGRARQVARERNGEPALTGENRAVADGGRTDIGEGRATGGRRAGAGEERTAGGGRTGAGEKRAAPPTDHDEWIALTHRLELSGQARELARNLHLQSREATHWDFVIAESLRHLGSAACVERLSRAISEELGRPVQVRLVGADDQPLRTPASLEDQRLRTKMTDAELAIDQDPTVRALQEQMGASVVENSIQPMQ